MNDIELEYRRALARFPRSWRRCHGEALLGVLLDNAQAEGRQQMSKTDRRDLVKLNRRLRVAHAVPVVLFLVAGLALLFACSLLLGGTPIDAQVLIHPPGIPVGGSYQPLFLVLTRAWAVYAVSVGVLVIATLLGVAMTRRNRRTDRIR